MARRVNSKRNGKPKRDMLQSRLELIKRRHHELILHPRKIIAADLNDEFGSPFDSAFEAERPSYVEAVDVGRF